MTRSIRSGRLAAGLLLASLVAACASSTVSPTPRVTASPDQTSAATPASPSSRTPIPAASTAPAGTAPASAATTATTGTPSAPSETPAATDTATPEPSTSTEPGASPTPDETGGTTAKGDIPDNAVFLTYQDATHGFSVDYVEGWQVTPGADGVVIRDKDSSETVQIIPTVTDVAAYISSSDLPALQALTGFKLEKQDTAKIGVHQYAHLVYHAPAAPDPVTGKEVPSTIDRYYVPGPTGLAVVSLSTPDGVDNVDAFKQMITSLTWP